MTTDNSLTLIRTRIDELDQHIQELITQRAQLAKEVAKAKYAEESQPHFYRPEREMEVLHKVISRNQGPLSNQTLIRIYREIMSECLALQKPLTIAFLGPEGTYSQAAVQTHFGHSIQPLPLPTIEEVFREVEANNADYGVVPVENSTEGGVNQTLDCFIYTPLKICSEIDLPIHHHLLSRSENLNQLTHIYAHQQSLAQCRLWLDTHLPNIQKIPVNSNAQAAQRAAQEPSSAAIAGQIAADLYQLSLLAKRIEDRANNTTRFAVMGKQDVLPTGKDKTSLLLSSPNRSGALYQLLAPFANHHISMTRIESRPAKQGIWEYIFFVDIEGHLEDPAVANSLKELETHTSLIKHLGSYPRSL